ncbi:MAG TPA: indolepyruvate ferredoxin oxidoreductase family protein [Acidimicrobiales bacterium]|nr:indolepyruvate ferredoxin oxidoreductase family protein [Acidimicrobiales bacterium]
MGLGPARPYHHRAGLKAARLVRSVSISDRYEATEGTVLLSGIEALVRLLLTQRRLDTQRGLSTALFISGYEGSPLGGLDQQLAGARALLQEADIVFVPGINEELAATAVGGTQLTVELPGRRVDGVVGFWYGKNPGLDRAADAIRHASASGTSPLGGAVALVGDDPLSKSSTLPSSCEQMARALGTPVLAPSAVADIIPLGLHAVALSRYAGLWTAMKIVADLADASATVRLPSLPTLGIPAPDQDRQWRPRALVGPGALAAEEDFVGVRVPRVFEYTEVAGLNAVVSEPTRPRLAILAAGVAYAATARALADLGLTPHDHDELGLRLVKIDLPWPLSTFALRAMVDRVDEVLVVEDKAPVVEDQLKAALYRQPHQPLVYGKERPDGSPCLPRQGAVTTELVADVLAHLWRDRPLPGPARHAVDQRNAPAPIRIDLRHEAAPVARTPYFCSGCPHNISTQADDEQLVGLGIGCHIMASFDEGGRGHQIGMTQMGGEGAQWIGMSPFTKDAHYAQNIGDGTFFHSGSLAVRAAVAAGVTMTYKILYNDAVAMTGGQTPVGKVGVPELTYWLAMEGVQRVIVTTPDPGEFAGADLHAIATVVHRDRLAETQRELAAVPGVTALIHHDPCAAEERRLRNRGIRPALTESVWINSRVCEGCGDCAEKATCMSLVHVPTAFGTKMSVHQGSCNLDKSCIRGECPSFVVARHRRGTHSAQLPDRPAPPAVLPEPAARRWSGQTVMRMPGIGGTGVVTASRIVQMAAHLAGLHAAGIDQTGLSQKGGPVTSDVRISSTPITGDVHASPRGADILLGFDLLGAAGDDALHVTSPERTVAILNTAEVPTATMLRHQGSAYPLAAGLLARIARSTRGNDMICLDAQRIAEELTGDHQAANLVLVGAAVQSGYLPIGVEELAEAVRLNGVDVDASLAAIAWGRAAVATPDTVTAALTSAPGAPASPPAPPLPERLRPSAHWPEDVRAVVALRVSELIAFQNQRVARSYLDRVTAVAERENKATGDPLMPVTEAFARGLFALTAIKDEYEVARLHLLPEEQAEFARAFPGARKAYLLKPPLLAALGLKRKISLVRTAPVAFRALRAARHVRGTPLDPFGWSAERRSDRHLRDEYQQAVDKAMLLLSSSNTAVVLGLANTANDVHGYAHVRAASVNRMRATMDRLLADLVHPGEDAEGSFRAAG